MSAHPHTQHVVLDAVAMADCDYTGLVTLAQVVADLGRDDVRVSVARANDAVTREVTSFPDRSLRRVKFYDSVDAAVNHAVD
jgi:MFS superfamily sulfate permease-like transporter